MYLLIRSDDSKLDLLAADHPGEIVLGGTLFCEIRPDAGCDFFLGFYDWLRTTNGSVVGVEITFHDGRERVQEILKASRLGAWITPDIVRVLLLTASRLIQVFQSIKSFLCRDVMWHPMVELRYSSTRPR